MAAVVEMVGGERKGLAKVEDAMRYLCVSRALLYKMMDGGRLGYVKLGRARRIRWADLERLVDENTVGG